MRGENGHIMRTVRSLSLREVSWVPLCAGDRADAAIPPLPPGAMDRLRAAMDAHTQRMFAQACGPRERRQ